MNIVQPFSNAMKKGSLMIVGSIFTLLLWGCGSSYQKAITHYQRGEYQSAIEDFEKVVTGGGLPANATSGDLYYQIGESYRLSNRVDLALPYYQQAMDAGYSHDSLFFVLANAYKANGQYQEAKKLYTQYAKIGSTFEAKRLAQAEVANADLIASLQKPNGYITVTNCDSLNTENAEYSPSFWNDKLVITSSRGDGKVYEGTGTRFTDLFYFDLDENSMCIGAPKAFPASINIPYLHEATATFSADGKTMVFARSNEGKKKDEFIEVDLYVSTYNGSTWTTPTMLSLSKDDTWDSSPALSPDGKTLYFASNRPGGQGGADIFKATRSNDGQYKGITPLGKAINTMGNELFPTVGADGTLYFASDGHPGIGGLDLFKVKNFGTDSVSVENLGAPINSIKDDFGLVMKDEKIGYFTSNRSSDGAKGDDDIFYFTDDSPDLDDVKYFLAGTTYNINYDNEKTLLTSVSVQLQDADGKVIEQKSSDGKGRYKFDTELSIGEAYFVNGQKTAHFPDSTNFDTEGKEATETDIAAGNFEITFETELVLKQDLFDGKLEEGGGNVTLENILYDLDDAKIRPDAALELDKLVQYMKDRPELKIELGSHTDVRGGNDYNMNLSRRRAESAVAYIVNKGIDASRITAKGYGETDLEVKNAQTEEEHQKNRRTTVKVVN